jgi:hypothetical protein
MMPAAWSWASMWGAGQGQRWTWRVRAGMAVTVVACLLLAACSRSDPATANPPAPTPPTTAPPPLQEQGAASDGGTVELGETGFSVLEVSQYGRAEIVWAAELENTSGTDLLAYVDVELAWSNAEGETEVLAWHETWDQRAYDVPPDTTVMLGGAWSVDFEPDSLEVLVNTKEWYPMQYLEARGLSVGVEVTDDSLVIDGQLRAQANFTSSYSRLAAGGDEALRLRVVLRDASGALIGAIGATDFSASPGEREEFWSVPLDLWPDGADLDNSEVTVMKGCCAWVAAG